MAVRTKCPCCGKPFSAPDECRSRKVDCPKCEHRFVLKTLEEIEEERHAAQLRELREAEDRERLALIESREKKVQLPVPGLTYSERFQTGRQAVRNYDPKAPSRYLRLRAFSDLFLVAAYVGLIGAGIACGLTVWLRVDGAIPSHGLLGLALVAEVLFGVAWYLGFKLLAELVHWLAEVGDGQYAVVRLLLDLRENTDHDED